MRKDESTDTLAGQLIDEGAVLSLAELCRACAVSVEWVSDLVEEGILEPQSGSGADWRFSGVCLRRVRVVARLQRDLGVNLSGAAVALELIEEIRHLRALHDQSLLLWSSDAE